MNKFTDKYFRDKAKEFFERSAGKDQQGLYLLLKEVSRDTRHACAEVRVKDYPFETFSRGGMDDKTEERIRGFDEGQRAHADACMNL